LLRPVEQAPMAISITDKKSQYTLRNEAFSKVTGYQPADILGENESLLSGQIHALKKCIMIYGIPSGVRGHGAGRCVIGINSVIAISQI